MADRTVGTPVTRIIFFIIIFLLFFIKLYIHMWFRKSRGYVYNRQLDVWRFFSSRWESVITPLSPSLSFETCCLFFFSNTTWDRCIFLRWILIKIVNKWMLKKYYTFLFFKPVTEYIVYNTVLCYLSYFNILIIYILIYQLLIPSFI